MTETPQQQDTNPGTGFDRDALRSFERLRRSTTDRKIAGVAGGLGRHLNIDPTILRVLFVVLVFFGGAGLLLYGAAWLLIPEEGSDEATISTSPSTRNTVLIVVGVLAAVLLIGDSWGGFGFPWPLAIIALVVVLFMVNRDRPSGSAPSSSPPVGSGQTEGQSSGWVSDTGTTYAAPTYGGQSDSTTYAGPSYTDTGYDVPTGPPSGPTSWAPAYTPAPAPRPSKKDRGPKLFGFTLAIIALALGVLGLVDASGVPVLDAAYPALALAVIGAMLVVGAYVGRPGGLIFLGIIASLALAAASTAGEYGWDEPDRLYAPTTAAAAAGIQDYDFFAGSTTVDLTQVSDLENLDGDTIDIDAWAGEIRVIVPEGLDVDVNASIDGGGEIEVAGVRDDGRSPVVIESIDGGDDVPAMQLDIDLNFGSIDVRQENAA
ncbi:MAG TPA: PspC domain-containing protein [Nocardioides sp.]|uniref:PspC domain-containing protein n=1 Tax=Nocardioides sp. TaxID=35761 RepID=UPI002D7F2575|nr:PspC domain-containing protein [Nocardioides sp.]HET6652500.1 PspC domain-containing protein [Nocardioides sp.]